MTDQPRRRFTSSGDFRVHREVARGQVIGDLRNAVTALESVAGWMSAYAGARSSQIDEANRIKEAAQRLLREVDPPDYVKRQRAEYDESSLPPPEEVPDRVLRIRNEDIENDDTDPDPAWEPETFVP